MYIFALARICTCLVVLILRQRISMWPKLLHVISSFLVSIHFCSKNSDLHFITRVVNVCVFFLTTVIRVIGFPRPHAHLDSQIWNVTTFFNRFFIILKFSEKMKSHKCEWIHNRTKRRCIAIYDKWVDTNDVDEDQQITS